MFFSKYYGPKLVYVIAKEKMSRYSVVLYFIKVSDQSKFVFDPP